MNRDITYRPLRNLILSKNTYIGNTHVGTYRRIALKRKISLAQDLRTVQLKMSLLKLPTETFQVLS